MKRTGRLQAARHWLTTQTGRTPVQIARSYRKHFGVDWPCAIQEMGMLGVHLEPEWVAQLCRTIEGEQRVRRQRQEKRKSEAVEDDRDSNEYFAFIAGYTPGGFAFGITWEEWRKMEKDERQAAEGECPF